MHVGVQKQDFETEKEKRKHGNPIKKVLKTTEGGARIQAAVLTPAFLRCAKEFQWSSSPSVAVRMWGAWFFYCWCLTQAAVHRLCVFYMCCKSHPNSPMGSGLHHHISFHYLFETDFYKRSLFRERGWGENKQTKKSRQKWDVKTLK